jgi:anti-anti-sigma factor
MHEGNVLYGRSGDVHVLRFVGDIRYTLSPSVERFVDGLFGATHPETFVVDLTETHSIDSTNLGLLARLTNRMQAGGGPPVTIVSGREDINELLLCIGFDEVFDIVWDNRPVATDTASVSVEESGREEMNRTMLAAHRALMALNEHNRDEFRDVVTLLEEEAAR